MMNGSKEQCCPMSPVSHLNIITCVHAADRTTSHEIATNHRHTSKKIKESTRYISGDEGRQVGQA